METKEGSIINLHEWEANKASEIFGNIAAEIRTGVLQPHFGDNSFLFAMTDEILYFALEGEKLASDAANYKERRAAIKQEILKNTDKTLEALPRYPENDCPDVREGVREIKSLIQKIRV